MRESCVRLCCEGKLWMMGMFVRQNQTGKGGSCLKCLHAKIRYILLALTWILLAQGILDEASIFFFY